MDLEPLSQYSKEKFNYLLHLLGDIKKTLGVRQFLQKGGVEHV
jgi:hypothetical protein